GQLWYCPTIIRQAFDAQRRNLCHHCSAASVKAVETKAYAQRIGQCAENAPIFTGIAGGKDRAFAALDAAFGVDRRKVFFRPCGGWQDDVSRMRALVTMMAHINLYRAGKIGE